MRGLLIAPTLQLQELHVKPEDPLEIKSTVKQEAQRKHSVRIHNYHLAWVFYRKESLWVSSKTKSQEKRDSCFLFSPQKLHRSPTAPRQLTQRLCPRLDRLDGTGFPWWDLGCRSLGQWRLGGEKLRARQTEPRALQVDFLKQKAPGILHQLASGDVWQEETSPARTLCCEWESPRQRSAPVTPQLEKSPSPFWRQSWCLHRTRAWAAQMEPSCLLFTCRSQILAEPCAVQLWGLG